MDPLSALSIATSVVQFVDYGTRLLSKARELHISAHGALTENIELEAASERLRTLTMPLQHVARDEALKHICTSCMAVSKELIMKLDNLKVPNGYKNKKWKSFRQAFKSVVSKGKIEEIKGRLHSLRMELNTHVLLDLRLVSPPIWLLGDCL